MTDIPDVSKYSPIYVVLRRVNGQNAYEGLVEESFSMSWSKDRVNMFWSGKAHSILGEHTINGKTWAEENAVSYRRHLPHDEILCVQVDCPESPININWEFWLEALKIGRARKYDARNAKFTMKE